jgi:prepilin-type N-terminal cleavage/methylation domain-containing protein
MRARCQRSDSAAGFSLLEVMVAMVLAGIGIAAMAQIFPMAGRGLGESRRETQATLAGQEKVEQLRALDLSDGLLTAGAHNDTTLVSETPYSRSWFVEDDKPLPGMKRVRMQVVRSGEDTTGAVVLTSVLGRR